MNGRFSSGRFSHEINPTIVAILCSAIVLLACVGSGTLFLMLMRRRQVLSLKGDDNDDVLVKGTPLLETTNHMGDENLKRDLRFLHQLNLLS